MDPIINAALGRLTTIHPLGPKGLPFQGVDDSCGAQVLTQISVTPVKVLRWSASRLQLGNCVVAIFLFFQSTEALVGLADQQSGALLTRN